MLFTACWCSRSVIQLTDATRTVRVRAGGVSALSVTSIAARVKLSGGCEAQLKEHTQINKQWVQG